MYLPVETNARIVAECSSLCNKGKVGELMEISIFISAYEICKNVIKSERINREKKTIEIVGLCCNNWFSIT